MKLDVIALTLPRVLKLTIFVMIDALIARRLGPERFGIYAYGGTIFMILLQLSRYSTDDIIVRALSHRTASDCMASILTVRLIGGALASSVFFVVYFIDPTLNRFGIVLWLYPAGLILASLAIMEPFLQANRQFKLLAVLQAAVLLTVGAIKLTLVLTTENVVPFLMVLPLEFALPVLFTLAIAMNGTLRATIDHRVAARTVLARFKETSHLVLAAVVMMAYTRLDQIMLTHFRSLTDAATYAAAYRIPEATAFLGSVICQVTFPRLLRMRAENDDAYKEELRQTARRLYVIGIAVTLVIALFSEPIIGLIFGPQYAASVSTMRILSLMVLPTFFGLFTFRWMVAENLAHLALMRSIFGIGLNVALNLVLIPSYGSDGAAVATVVTLNVTYFGTLFFTPSTRPFGRLVVSAAIPWKVK